MGKTRRAIATVDLETDPFKRDRVPQPFMVGFYDGERFRRFDDVSSFMRYISDKEFIIYAHNGGKFDFHYMFEFLEPWTDVLIIHGRLVKFKIGECEFRDSYSILPIPLSAYKKDAIDMAKLEPEVRHKHLPEIERYLRGDCVYLYELVTDFVRDYGNSLTLAGAAMQFWSKHFEHEKPISSQTFYDTIKDYYYGGRVECFAKGIIPSKRFQVVDINSAYPYAMLHKHPLSTSYETVRPKRGEAVIPQSLYTVVATSRGAFPRRAEDKSLEFPTDDVAREYKVTGWELQAALDTGRADVHEVVSRLDFLKELDFEDYVSHFYKIKSTAKKDTTAYLFSKLMMNSLYGKFGANPATYKSYGLVPREDAEQVEKDASIRLGRAVGPWRWAGSVGHMGLMAGEHIVVDADGRKQSVNNPVESDFYNAATAASITGFVRAYLLRHMDAVQKAGGRLFYCDTDSVVFEAAPDDVSPFRFSKALGDWSHEGYFVRGGIAGKKLYAFLGEDGKWKAARKGVRLEPEQIMEVAAGGEVEWEAQAPSFTMSARVKTGKREIKPVFMKRKIKGT